MEADIDGEPFGIILQNAETVRLVSTGTDSASIPVTSLKDGDDLLLYQQQGARHTGMAIKEKILEK